MSDLSIPLIDLHAPYDALRTEIDAAITRVLESGWYILGKEVAAFEEEFAAYLSDASSAVECVGVASGTDALHLALRACEIGPGDEVITVAHTAVATAAAISLTGAQPVFVDIDPDSYTLDPSTLRAALSERTRAIIPVHIYGHPAEMDPIMAIATEAGVFVIEDCAQAHGARYKGQQVGTIGDMGCFSFYPTKNLGALGDGGALVSRKPELAAQTRHLREYGWTPETRYVSQQQGMNSRLDEMQAAILRVKLRHLDEWNEIRRSLAHLYTETLPQTLQLPTEQATSQHVYHLYVVRLPQEGNSQREHVRAQLQQQGIGTGIHYPVPVHQQPAYAGLDHAPFPLPNTEQIAGEILSLPMYPQLAQEQVCQVASTLTEIVTQSRVATPISDV